MSASIDPCLELKAKLTETEARLKELPALSSILHGLELLTRQPHLTEDQRMSKRTALRFKWDQRRQLRREREDLRDEIEDAYCAMQEANDERYQLPH
tara:strand:- start:135 stop:425 length:291 start_codon:yes stop_codon:yes gene_type:complete